MLSLKQFREITANMPEDSLIELETHFTPGSSGSVETWDILASREKKRIILMPQHVYISDGENDLYVEHKKK